MKAVTQVAAASLAEANEALYTSLTYGIALEQDRGDGRKSHTVRFLDFGAPVRAVRAVGGVRPGRLPSRIRHR